MAQGNSNIGTVTVAPGASISIMNGGVLDLGGVDSLLDDSGTSTNGNAVAVTVGQGDHFDLTNIEHHHHHRQRHYPPDDRRAHA